MEKKSISKSIRLTPTVYNYICSYPGNGFNEQFENIILEAKEFEEDRKKKIAWYDECIERKIQEYYKLRDEIEKLNNFLLVAVRANTMIKELDALTDEIVSHK